MSTIDEQDHGWRTEPVKPQTGRKSKLTPVQLVLMKQGQYRRFKPCGTGTPR